MLLRLSKPVLCLLEEPFFSIFAPSILKAWLKLWKLKPVGVIEPLLVSMAASKDVDAILRDQSKPSSLTCCVPRSRLRSGSTLRARLGQLAPHHHFR